MAEGDSGLRTICSIGGIEDRSAPTPSLVEITYASWYGPQSAAGDATATGSEGALLTANGFNFEERKRAE
jgi:hypothetical protein